MPLKLCLHLYYIILYKSIGLVSLCVSLSVSMLSSASSDLQALPLRAKLASRNTGVRSQPGYTTMETRSATKQHELEEQIGSLATLMKELKAGQAEQAKCREQQTKFFELNPETGAAADSTGK